MSMFEIATVVAVLGIFSIFAIAAAKADKVVSEKARVKREAAQAKLGDKSVKKAH